MITGTMAWFTNSAAKVYFAQLASVALMVLWRSNCENNPALAMRIMFVAVVMTIVPSMTEVSRNIWS